MNQNQLLVSIGLILLGVLIAVSSVYSVDEREKVVVVRFGKILRDDDAPGLHGKLPFIDDARSFNSRLLTLSEEAQSFRTADDKNVTADIFVKWRIVDVRQYYLAGGSQEAAAKNLLEPIVNRLVGDEFGKRPLKNVIAGDWHQLTDSLAPSADKDARKLGIEIVDVRLQRIGVPALSPVYERMKAERARVVNERRAQGAETADKIRVEAERSRDMVLAEAHARAERLRGEGDARAAAIYANAAAVAPEFYIFYRSLSAYKEVFRKKDDVLVLDPSSDFFKYMKKPTR